MNLRAFYVWLMIIAAESVGGALRELFLEIPLGDRVTHKVGVAVGYALLIVVTLAAIRWMRVETTHWLLAVGGLWMVMTFTFETVPSRIFIDGSFERVMADYDPRRGGFMLLGMAVLALAPLVAARLRGIPDKGAMR